MLIIILIPQRGVQTYFFSENLAHFKVNMDNPNLKVDNTKKLSVDPLALLCKI